MKYNFECDYCELAHPKIMSALFELSREQNEGYGNDDHTRNAEAKIREIFGTPEASVFFLTGGTQVNLTVISYLLRPYEGAISVHSGHINTRECAAVEGTGHKILGIDGVEGKITPAGIRKALEGHKDVHAARYKLVYISNSTEFGTIYHKSELEEIYKVCKENDLYLFIDGARLASALTSPENDMTPKEFASLCDVFYIGGTKNGLISGEAVVFKDPVLAKDFFYHVKNRGALVAKGYALGIQFEEVFKDNLYFEMGKHANDLAYMIRSTLKECGIKFFMDSPTNQLFPILKKDMFNQLSENFIFEIKKDLGDEVCVRICTSWSTKREKVMDLIAQIVEIHCGGEITRNEFTDENKSLPVEI